MLCLGATKSRAWGREMAASIAVAANCSFLIARTPEDFKAIVHALLNSSSGNQFDRTKLLRQLKLWRKMVWDSRNSALFDVGRFADN
jgi:hypothetical protein